MTTEPSPASRPLLAIINTSPEIAELLRMVAIDEGYDAVIGWVREFRDGGRDLGAFLREHEPTAVIWDIALPYEENWVFVQGLRTGGALTGYPLVLTTTNLEALTRLVGPTDSIELIGKPYDLNQIFAAVRRTIAAHA